MRPSITKPPTVDISFILQSCPGYVYWKNLDSVYIGCNQNNALIAGLKTPEDIIGKTDYELNWGDSKAAAKAIRDDKYVIETGDTLVTEDILTTRNEKGIFSVVRTEKTPLYDCNHNIIGVLGVAVDITDQKESERLKMENEVSKLAAERLEFEKAKLEIENKEKEYQLRIEAKLREVASQAVHDMGSPLSSLVGIADDSPELSEQKRITLREATLTLGDIATHWENEFKNTDAKDEERQPLLVLNALENVLSQKRYMYKKSNVKFETDFRADSSFTFIKAAPSHFKRMISNLINNAVDALEDKLGGTVKVRLRDDNEWVIISISDNGVGMTPKMQDNIKNNTQKSFGKLNGKGIGLGQIHKTLKSNLGKLDIHSILGGGSKIIIRFPKIVIPAFIAQEIKIIKGDTIVIVDDDSSIHGTWGFKLTPVLEKLPTLKILNFTDGLTAVNFINNLTKTEKTKVCLLTDYQLLQQDLNGIDIIKQTGIKRSTLVTSHHLEPELWKQAINAKTKILPKSLVSAVAITIDKKIKPGSKKVDMVWVEDQLGWLDNKIKNHYSKLKIDKYAEPLSFLEDVSQYPLDTRVILDSSYLEAGVNMSGFEVAKKLHELGYTKLYLTTSQDLDNIPKLSYLTVISKSESQRIAMLDKL
jgi:signal transduction histidine kinase